MAFTAAFSQDSILKETGASVHACSFLVFRRAAHWQMLRVPAIVFCHLLHNMLKGTVSYGYAYGWWDNHCVCWLFICIKRRLGRKYQSLPMLKLHVYIQVTLDLRSWKSCLLDQSFMDVPLFLLIHLSFFSQDIILIDLWSILRIQTFTARAENTLLWLFFVKPSSTLS